MPSRRSTYLFRTLLLSTLFLLTLAISSHKLSLALGYEGPPRALYALSTYGLLIIYTNPSPPTAPPTAPPRWFFNSWPGSLSLSAPYRSNWWHNAGFSLAKGTTTTGLPIYALSIPYWFLTLLAATLTTLTYLRHRRNIRTPGHCPTCQYDLRASSTQCPECGTLISLPPKA